MKRIISLIFVLILSIGAQQAIARQTVDLSSAQRYASTYFQGTAPMIQGLSLNSYGIDRSLTAKLKALQVIVLEGSSNIEKGRETIRQLIKEFDVGLEMKSSRSHIVVYGTANRDGIYKQVVVGVGLPGKLIYIYLEGDNIISHDISRLLQPYQ